MKLQDKAALITGGTPGIGLAAAKLFHADGARVFVTGRSEAGIAEARKLTVEIGMKLILMFVAAVAAAAVSFGASAQDWKLVALAGGQLIFADGGRIQRNAVAASLWALESYPEVRHVDDGWYPHRSRSLRYVFNCSEQTYAIAQWVLHEGALGHGEAVWADRATVAAFAPVQAGDPQAALLAAACGGSALAQQPSSARAN